MQHDQNSDRTPPVSRRGFLCGAGMTLALPWLESLPVRAESGKLISAANQPSSPPIRFGCVYFSNGVEPAHWWAKGSGSEMEFGPVLEPLRPFREELVVLDGLFNQQAADNPSAHLGRMPNLLSGAWVSLDQNDIRVGRTMDQVLADQIGRETAIPSLVLGVEPTELRLEDGLSMIYGSCISWTSDTRPATKEIYPSRAFDQIVGTGGSRQLDRTILDEVLEDATSLRNQIAQSDRTKLDEYLESIRDIENRIDRATREQRLEGWRPTLNSPNMPRPDEQLPQDVPNHMRLMLDMIVLAFQMDKTRIATCMLNNDLSQMNFGFLEGVQGSLHLDLTHNGRDEELEAMYLKTNQFHFQQFGYLLQRLSEIDEGGQTLLDNSLLIGCSNLFDGDKHQADRMPFVIAGRGGGSLETGRVLNYLDQQDDDRRACSLYLSLMDRMGVQLPRFGDSDRRLDRL
ncbi:MAG: DUF1552 domain-containing protein [Planctomycetaceae bacterium]|nr:DUF1552 domain-containing protein [Planctomycetaceae bacterium]